jgi:hypothetical protein
MAAEAAWPGTSTVALELQQAGPPDSDGDPGVAAAPVTVLGGFRVPPAAIPGRRRARRDGHCAAQPGPV